MPEPDVQIKITTTKDGTGAQQTKQELDALTGSAQNVASTSRGVSSELFGLTAVFRGLSYAVASAQMGIRGMAMAIGGLFQVIVAHPIGRLVGACIMLGGALYEVIAGLKKTKEITEEAKSKADIAAKALEKIAQTKLDNLIKYVSEVNEGLQRTLERSNAAFEALKQLREAELGGEKAKTKMAVASGQITAAEGERRNALADYKTKTELREAENMKLEEDQAAIEDAYEQNRIMLKTVRNKKEESQKNYEASKAQAEDDELVTPEELQAGKLELEEAQKRAQKKLADAQAIGTVSKWAPWRTNNEGKQQQVAQAERELSELNRLENDQQIKEAADEASKSVESDLQKKVEEQEALHKKQQAQIEVAPLEQKTADEELKASLLEINTKEEQRRKSEELKLQREALEREYQKAEEAKNVAKAGQLSKEIAATKVQEYETSITGTKVEPAMQAAEKKNINEQQAAVFEKFSTGQEKKAAEEEATLILELERAKAKDAEIQLQAARKADVAKHLSPHAKKQADANLQSAQARWSQESAGVAQASALQSRIRSAVDPEDVAKLLAALESIGQSFKQVANAADQQASQMKNGGVRTK